MIHTSSIKTMFDKNHIDKLHFGGSIKTYVIPCRYNQLKPFESVNGEYQILFQTPPYDHFEYFKDIGLHNRNFEEFMQKFDDGFAYDNYSPQFCLFKITTSGELAFIESKKLETVGTLADHYGACYTPTLSLFTSNQLHLDQYNNVVGIRWMTPHDYATDMLFANVDFKVSMIRQNWINDEIATKQLNRISEYYSLGESNYEWVDNNGTSDAYTQWSSGYNNGNASIVEFDRYYGQPIYYSPDGDTFEIKKVYSNSMFLSMLPNKYNQKQLVIFHKTSAYNPVTMDLYDGDNDVVSTVLDNINTVEWIKDDEYQITLKNDVENFYTATFNWLKFKFENIIEIESNVSHRIGNISGFIYNDISFSTEIYSTSSYKMFNINNDHPVQSWYYDLTRLYGITKSFINNDAVDFNKIREACSIFAIDRDEGIGRMYFYNFVYTQSNGYNFDPRSALVSQYKNITPLVYEIGNWAIIPNHNILLPNTDDVLKSTIIHNGLNQDLTYLYTINDNVNVVKIVDTHNLINNISGNIIKINQVDSTTSLYSFSSLMIIDSENDSTNTFELDHYGVINNFITPESVDGTLPNKTFISKISSTEIGDYGAMYNLKFYIKYNDMIDFINDDKFIKLTGSDTFSLNLGGKELPDLNFASDPYALLKSTFEFDDIDFSDLSNDNNTFIPNIVTSQNTVPKTLYGMVIDNGSKYQLCKFPYQKIKHYSNLQPVMNGNISSYDIDHFTDEDGTVYSKESIDFITLSINGDVTDFEMNINAAKNILKIAQNYTFTNVDYELDTFANVAPFYLVGDTLDIDSVPLTEEVNVTAIMDGTKELKVSKPNNNPHRFDLDLSGYSIADKEEICITIESDSTAHEDNNIGIVNMFDNILYNDGMSLTFQCEYLTYSDIKTQFRTVYYDWISTDFDIWKHSTGGTNYDMEQYGQYALKCLYFVMLNPTPNIMFLNYAENAISKSKMSSIVPDAPSTYWASGSSYGTYQGAGDSTSVTYTYDNYPSTSTPRILFRMFSYWQNYSVQDVTYNRLSEESIENKNSSSALTWISNWDLNWTLNKAHEQMQYTYSNYKTRFDHSNIYSFPMMFQDLQTLFGVIITDTTANIPDDVRDNWYIGCGEIFHNCVSSKFWGIPVKDTPYKMIDDLDNANADTFMDMDATNYFETVIVLDKSKSGTKDMCTFTIDGTNFSDNMIEITSDSKYLTESAPPRDINNKTKHGLYGAHRDYAMFFDCELTSDEMAYIMDEGNRIALAEKMSTNLGKTAPENYVTSLKEYNSLHDVNRNCVKIVIRNVNGKMYVYVNGHLYSQVNITNVINLNNLRLFGNSWFSDKKITISKQLDVTSEYTQTYC